MKSVSMEPNRYSTGYKGYSAKCVGGETFGQGAFARLEAGGGNSTLRFREEEKDAGAMREVKISKGGGFCHSEQIFRLTRRAILVDCALPG